MLSLSSDKTVAANKSIPDTPEPDVGQNNYQVAETFSETFLNPLLIARPFLADCNALINN